MNKCRGLTALGDNHTNSVTNVTGTLAQPGIIAYVGLGSNLGSREINIGTALRKLEADPTIELTQVSSFYETAPVGVTDQPDFLNLAASLRTSLPPDDLLRVFLHIENQMGRVRTSRWGPRVIDIDLLLYGDRQIETPGLTVPHPRLRERAFVLVPLAEIAPNLALPGDEKKIQELIAALTDNGNIQRRTVV